MSEVTCTLIKDNGIYQSSAKGIKPLLLWINNDPQLIENSYVIDKIVGKASALLLIYAKISKVHGKTMSVDADRVLSEHNIEHSYDILTEHIINRENTGLCPMEIKVADIEDPSEAYQVLNNAVYPQ